MQSDFCCQSFLTDTNRQSTVDYRTPTAFKLLSILTGIILHVYTLLLGNRNICIFYNHEDHNCQYIYCSVAVCFCLVFVKGDLEHSTASSVTPVVHYWPLKWIPSLSLIKWWYYAINIALVTGLTLKSDTLSKSFII